MPVLNFKAGISITGQVSDRTPNFTGREWVFQAIHQWLSDPNGSRYFLLTGEPGAGKTVISDRLSQFSYSPVALHPNLLPGFLSAVHRCSARDSTTVDPKTFARSIALQLAQHIPPFAQALKDIGEKQVNIHVDLSIGAANGSTIQAIVIQNLNLAGVMTAQEAFSWVVLQPLHTLYQTGFDQPITILVDALDEALTHSGDRTIVDLLSSLEHLPPQVRFILTSRNVAQVENRFLHAEELNLSAPESHIQNQADLHAYVQTRCSSNTPLSTHLSDLEPHRQAIAIDQITQKAEGNFLYVRFLLDEIEQGKRSLTDLEELPEGLDGLYYESLARVVKLSKQDWHTTYAPLVGILSVARTSLTLSHLQVFTKQSESTLWQCLGDLREFLEALEPQTTAAPETSYRLYHQSMMDFLRKRSFKLGKHTRHNPYYLPAQESHQCIANHYWQPPQPLEALAWQHLDSYAYHHLAGHLLESDRKEDLCTLLTASPRWMEAKFIPCAGDASYAADLDLAITCFSDPLTAPQLFSLSQLHTARQVVIQRGNRYDNIDLRTLVWLGRGAEALNHTRLRANPQTRFWGLYILYKLLAQKGQPAPALLPELQTTADSIKTPHERVSALAAIAHTLAKAGCLVEAEAIFAEARQLALQIDNHSQQTWALKELITPLADAGYFLTAEEIARTIEDRKWRAWSLATLGALLAKANQPDPSKALFSESQDQALMLSNNHDQAWLLKAIVGALIEASDLDAAEAVTQLIRDPQKRAEALSELGTAFVKAALETKANAMFIEAEILGRSINYDFQQGEALQALAKALAQAKHYAEAERIALTIEVDWAGTGALVELAATLAQDEQFTEADRIAEMIQDQGGRAFVLRVLALVYARTGNPMAATQFFQEAGAIAPAIEDGEISVFAMTILATTLKKAGHEAQAEQIFQEAVAAARSIENDISQKSTLRAIVTELAQQHILPEAEIFARAIQGPLDRAWALREIAIVLAKDGCKAKASRIFTEIEKLAEVVKDSQCEGLALRHKGWVLEELSKALTQVRYFAEAERVARTIDDRWKQPEAFAELSKALAQDQQFSEAERVARAIPETEWERVEALCTLAVALTHAGEQARAETLFTEAKQLAASIEDLTWKPRALRALVIAFTQTERFVEAEAIISEIEDKEMQARALQELAIASGQPNHFTAAIKAAEASEDGWQRSELLQELAKAMIQLGQDTRGNELFTAAENAVKSVEPRYQADILKGLAISNAHLRRFSESRRIIDTIDHWKARDQALAVLARELTQVGQFTDAQQLIQTIEEAKEQRWALGSLAIALMRQQRFAEALKELETQTPDDFVHILAICASIFDQLETGLSLAILNHTLRIIGWVRTDWRKMHWPVEG
jgi:tetratricopeptide (TPR) repeat protein/RNase adaptor protein for sRNA GlmZ degradation